MLIALRGENRDDCERGQHLDECSPSDMTVLRVHDNTQEMAWLSILAFMSRQCLGAGATMGDRDWLSVPSVIDGAAADDGVHRGALLWVELL